jgi:hypothetical protein
MDIRRGVDKGLTKLGAKMQLGIIVYTMLKDPYIICLKR